MRGSEENFRQLIYDKKKMAQGPNLHCIPPGSTSQGPRTLISSFNPAFLTFRLILFANVTSVFLAKYTIPQNPFARDKWPVRVISQDGARIFCSGKSRILLLGFEGCLGMGTWEFGVLSPVVGVKVALVSDDTGDRSLVEGRWGMFFGKDFNTSPSAYR